MAYRETLNSSAFNEQQTEISYQVSAGVGLLSRNIKITSQKQQAGLGFRLIVADYVGQRGRRITNYKGKARISNVELIGPGQANHVKTNTWLGLYDSGIVFINNKAESNYFVNNSLHNSMGSGVTVAGSIPVKIEGNVMHESVGWAIRVLPKAGNCIIRRNLVVKTHSSNTQFGWDNYFGAIDVRHRVRMGGNLVAGSELVGVRWHATQFDESCDSMSDEVLNEVFASAAGVVVFEEHQTTCVHHVGGFLIYKSSEYGVYYQGRNRVSISRNILLQNQIGVFIMIYGPPALSDMCIVEECVIVGKVGNNSDCDWSISGNKRKLESFGSGNDGKGMIGIVWPSFMSYGNGAPVFSWSSSRSNSQISGGLRVRNTIFAHFSPK